MRRLVLSVVTAALLAAGALAVAGPAGAAAPTSIVGTWSGQLTSSSGGLASARRFTFVVYPGERRGTWQTSSTCAGTLRLKNISDGYHHFYRVAGAHRGCVAPGVDCLRRDGARMDDEFTSNSGKADASGTFRRRG